jgi:hypothetical protein
MANAGLDDDVRQLAEDGFTWIRGRFEDADAAFAVGRSLIDARRGADGAAPLELVGDFALPPPDGPPSRDFQTLHFDFGLPVNPKVEQDVGRFTALHVPMSFGRVSAVTRVVPLASLLRQRLWPPRQELVARLAAYGRTHGSFDDDRGYVEGSLARLVEAAAPDSALLPSVKAEPGFLCGTEFDSLRAEVRFFADHSLDVEAVQHEVALSPGELLVFDNLAVAHGRRGTRRPGELRQWVFGETGLSVAAQRKLRDDVLAAFARHLPGVCRLA